MAELLGQKNSTLQGSLAIDTSRPGATRKKWSTTYLVKGTSGETEEDILEFGPLPTLYHPYRNGYCTRKDATEVTEVAEGFLWKVKCSFDSHIDAEIPVIDVSWDVEEQQTVQHYDAVTGALITNSFGQPIKVETPQSIPILTLKRIEPVFSGAVILAYNNHINSLPFWGAPAYCARMIGPRAKKKIIQGMRYWEVTYRVKFNMSIHPRTLQPYGWIATLLDRGWTFENDDGESESGETDVDQRPQEVNLDGNGRELGDDQPPVFLFYNKFPIADFTPLGLDA